LSFQLLEQALNRAAIAQDDKAPALAERLIAASFMSAVSAAVIRAQSH
jgi:hypothetical protein